ncbi:PF11899 family protein [Bacteriovorax sp. BSW11_IV]|uniref:DUF3419 family protein n=1 Tax=Bacteriovorax sp. BSW11_IV TaxID=1353529 RepID=UPI00038A1526|nr:DUF3419 family protein [Bacteriovorax sp. BSW11_IV]EQC43664.1 PF11899 family protein [Bacteriovorax sp. BSW11_IV]
MTKKYFSELNYSLGNEDTRLEVAMVKKLSPKNIFAIAGCGSRALPLVLDGVKRLVCADVSQNQLYITELRRETIRHFTFQDFLLFWGFPPYGSYDYSHKRRELFYTLSLSDEANVYFLELFKDNGWKSILYLGKWEKTFKVLAKINRSILGKNYDRIFNFYHIGDQARYYENDFPFKKWQMVLFVLGNKAMFNALLYKGDFIKKNVSESYLDYYQNAFEHLMTEQLARESYFMHLCFFGEISHADGNPVEATEENFNTVKKNLAEAKVDLVATDMVSAIKNEGPFDFLSLSDVPSYFAGDLEKNFLQDIRPGLAPGAVLVIRSYLRIPEADESGFVDITPQFGPEIFDEKVQMYKVKVLKFTGE